MYHDDIKRCGVLFTLKLGMGLGLVGDGVEDLVDRGAEIWPLEIPFTVWRKTGRAGEMDPLSRTPVQCNLFHIFICIQFIFTLGHPWYVFCLFL